MVSFDDIVADFAFLDDWDDRYKYLIDLGRRLEPYPENSRDEAHRVKGCASQVWLKVGFEDRDGARIMRLVGDSDAHIVKGLVALMIAFYSGRPVADAAELDARQALEPLGLATHLTPQRSNGLAAMVARIRALATQTDIETGSVDRMTS